MCNKAKIWFWVSLALPAWHTSNIKGGLLFRWWKVVLLLW